MAPAKVGLARLVVGSLAVSALIGLITVLDGAGVDVVHGLLAALIALPAVLACMVFLRRKDLVGSVVGVAIMVAVVVVIPMSVSGQMPRRGGGGPAPSLVVQALLGLAASGAGALVGWGSYEFVQRRRTGGASDD